MLGSRDKRARAEAEVWLGAATLTWPQGGGHFWVYLNWALGLRRAGCRVVWLEHVHRNVPDDYLPVLKRALEGKLARYGLGDCLALYRDGGEPVQGTILLERAAHADMLLNVAYADHQDVLSAFARTALLDIDPGLTQLWQRDDHAHLPVHDAYFTIGETVGHPGSRIPSNGIAWQHTPPCVAVEQWPVTPVRDDAPFTTVSNWESTEWLVMDGEVLNNRKRAGFEPFLTLPARVDVPLELSLCLEADEGLRLTEYDEGERQRLERLGWRVRHSYETAAEPWQYQRYLQSSRGEFSCVKPSCLRLQNAWVSDRSLCYLASGRPAVVQDTGPSELLPDRAGLLRFETLEEAAECIEIAHRDHRRQARLARELVEERFSADAVVPHLLDRALTRPAPIL